MTLALSTVLFEWRRYLAAMMALSLSGLLVLVMTGLFSGILKMSLASIERSRAEIFIMPMDTDTLISSNPTLPARVVPLLFRNSEVTEARSIRDVSGEWANKPNDGERQVRKLVTVSLVDPIRNAVNLPVDFGEDVRLALMEPRSIAIDAADIDSLGVKLNDSAIINGHYVHVRAVLRGYQSLDHIQLFASRDTVRLLGSDTDEANIGPIMVRINNPKNTNMVVDQLNSISGGLYKAWSRQDFMENNQNAMLAIAFVGVMIKFILGISALIGIGITSQTLRGAVLSNIREFANLRALGIPMSALYFIVMEIAFWCGVAGLLLSVILTAIVVFFAGALGLPIVVRLDSGFMVFVLLLSVAVMSGALALGVLRRSQPAELLR
jgi:putative ABC transport system permease protein